MGAASLSAGGIRERRARAKERLVTPRHWSVLRVEGRGVRQRAPARRAGRSVRTRARAPCACSNVLCACIAGWRERGREGGREGGRGAHDSMTYTGGLVTGRRVSCKPERRRHPGAAPWSDEPERRANLKDRLVTSLHCSVLRQKGRGDKNARARACALRRALCARAIDRRAVEKETDLEQRPHLVNSSLKACGGSCCGGVALSCSEPAHNRLPDLPGHALD